MIDSIQRAYVSFESALRKYGQRPPTLVVTKLGILSLTTLLVCRIHPQTYQKVQSPGNQVVVLPGFDPRYDDSEWIHCQHTYYGIQVYCASAIA